MEEVKKSDLEQQFASIFGGSSKMDDDFLKVLDKHTLQLNAQQIKAYLFFRSFKNPFMDELLDQYIEIKHHNGSGELILRGVNAISLRNFIANFKFNVNTTK